MSRAMRKPDFAYAKTKAQISCAVTAPLISANVFATWIVQFPLNIKFDIAGFQQFSVSVQVGLCRTWWDTTLFVLS